MLVPLILAAALTSAGPVAEDSDPSSPREAVLKEYESARAQAGRDADAQVGLALWCERHGLSAERIKHLALAVIRDPKHAKARALMGMVAFGGRWERPEDVGKTLNEDAGMVGVLAEYHARRARTPVTADGHWKLALWCEARGLESEARAHFTAVVRLDPRREASWKRLGYRREKGRWVTEANLAAAKAEAEVQKRADKKWRPLLESYRARLERPATRPGAVEALADVTDPRALPMIWHVFAGRTTRQQLVAVQLLGQIDSSLASRLLAIMAASRPSADVRRAAIETLKRRDPREFAELLIALLRDPIKYRSRPVSGPGSSGELAVQGDRVDVQRRYSPPPAPEMNPSPDDYFTLDANGLPVLNHVIDTNTIMIDTWDGNVFKDTMISNHQNLIDVRNQLAQSPLGEKGRQIGQFLVDHPSTSPTIPMGGNSIEAELNYEMALSRLGLLGSSADPIHRFSIMYAEALQIPVGRMAAEAQTSAAVAQRQLQGDVDAIERTNAEIARRNAPVLAALEGGTGQDFGADRKAWSKWIADAKGYAFLSSQTERPTVVEEVPLDYVPQTLPVTVTSTVVGFQAISCFGAGTEVHTITGRRPIESLKVGDRVLTRDVTTGALSYRPILTVFHNPPSPTLKVELGDETIVTTPWHRFWQAGKGWVVARDLKPGDAIRTLDQPSRVVSVREGAVMPVFNLEVEGDRDFLVGRQGALVHDNTVADDVASPFDGSTAKAETMDHRK